MVRWQTSSWRRSRRGSSLRSVSGQDANCVSSRLPARTRSIRGGARAAGDSRRRQRRAGRIPDTLLLLQHPHVITIGVRGEGWRVAYRLRRASSRPVASKCLRLAAAVMSPITALGRSSPIPFSICGRTAGTCIATFAIWKR